MLQTLKEDFQDLRNFRNICSGSASNILSTKKIHGKEEAVKRKFFCEIEIRLDGLCFCGYNFHFQDLIIRSEK